VPPAWSDVWICPYPNGHLQATGIDDRGRKQYRYHQKWREVRDSDKYEQILRFAETLPVIREQVKADLDLQGVPREKVLAAVVKLLDITLIRIGNAEYAKTNESYGLTTLRRKHVDVNGSEIRFRFTGKSGKEWNLSVRDRRIANIVRKCSELPGYELFKYEDDDGELVDVASEDVNAYLREISGEEYTAKDFRTWSGTVLAAIALSELEGFDSTAKAKSNIVHAIEQVAGQLGNTPAICRKCYVHPEILAAYLDGALAGMISSEINTRIRNEAASLSPEELIVLALLRKRLDTGAQPSKP
jgi:DNA topoisomerase-1